MWSWMQADRRRVLGTAVALLGAVAVWRALPDWGPSEAVLAEGREIFEHVWTENDPLAGGGDGLGPVFNERSCVACHFQGGVGGAGTNEFNVNSFEVLPSKNRAEHLAGVIHADAVRPELRETFQLVRAEYPIEKAPPPPPGHCGYSPPDFDPLRTSVVNTPALFGLGLVDDLSAWSLRGGNVTRSFGQIGRELNGDFTGIPVGRINSAAGGVGKFGWKGQFTTLEEFVATACAVELGLSNPLRKQDVPQRSTEDTEARLDIDRAQLRALVEFVRALPRPEQVLPTGPAERARVRHGEAVFTSLGCAECHTPSLGGIDGFYSDLMLHVVDDPDGDGYDEPLRSPDVRDDGSAAPNEWKTPPLWGVADSAPYFHDGGSPTLIDAIQRHTGDARRVTERFRGAPSEDRAAVVAFLETLKAPTTAIPVAMQPTP